MEPGIDFTGTVHGPFPVSGAGAETRLGNSDVRHMLRRAAKLAGKCIRKFQEFHRLLFTEGFE